MALHLSRNKAYIRLKSSRLFKDSFWALIGNVLNKGLSLLAGIIVARWLGAEEYGEYGMIKNTLIYIAVFSTFGLGFSVTKFIAHHKETDIGKLYLISRAANLISLAFSGIMALLLFIFSESVASYLEMPQTSLTIKFTAIAVVFNSLATVQIAVLAGLKEFKRTARINFQIGLVTFIASICGTYFYGLDGAIMALVITNFANCILNFLLIRKLIRPGDISYHDIIKEVTHLIRFSFPIAIQESTISISFWLGNLLLIKLSDYHQLGLYSAAAQWGGIVLYIPGVLQNVMLSHLSTSVAQQGNSKTLLHRMLALNFCMTLIPFIVVAGLSSFIASIYGASYSDLPPVLNICVATAIFNCLIQVYIQEYIAKGRTWILCLIRSIRDILALVLAWILITNISDIDAAILYTTSYLVAAIFCLASLMLLNHKEY